MIELLAYSDCAVAHCHLAEEEREDAYFDCVVAVCHLAEKAGCFILIALWLSVFCVSSMPSVGCGFFPVKVTFFSMWA